MEVRRYHGLRTPRDFVVCGGASSHQYGLTTTGSQASAVWPTAKLVFYYPFRVPHPGMVVEGLWWNNGATASGNIDAGIYSAGPGGPQQKLCSTGSTAQGTISVRQDVDITDYLLGGGNFYFALTVDNTTATLSRAQIAAAIWPNNLLGILEETTGSFGLPAVATPVTAAALNFMVFCGILGSAIR